MGWRVVSEDSDGIVPATQINLQSLKLSLGKEKPELFHCSTGHFPRLFWDWRVLIRFPNVDPFSKHIQRFVHFLEWFSSTLAIKAKLPLLAQSQPAAQARAQLTLQRPKPQREETLSLEARSHWHWPRVGTRGWKDCLPTPHPEPSTRLWPAMKEPDWEKVRGGVEGRGKKV